MTKKTIYIPLEIFKRELRPKLLLALFLANHGYRVVIGHKWHVNSIVSSMATLGDVYLFKGLLQNESSNFFDSLKKSGVTTVSFDEEGGLAYENYAEYAIRYGFESGIEKFQHWLTWGPRDYEYLIGRKIVGSDIHSFGTPRSAYWQLVQNNLRSLTPLKSTKIEYALVATNFTFDEKYSKSVMKMLGESSKDISDILIEDLKLGLIKNANEKNYFLFLSTINVLLQETKLNIVIRPHPIEPTSSFSKKLSKLDSRIILDTNFDVSDSIISAKVIVHSGSTVGIEAAVIGKPSISIDRIGNNHNSKLEYKRQNFWSSPNDLQQFRQLISGLDDRSDKSESFSQNDLIWGQQNLSFYEEFIDVICQDGKTNPVLHNDRIWMSNKLQKSNIIEIEDAMRSLRNFRSSKVDIVKRPFLSSKMLRQEIIKVNRLGKQFPIIDFRRIANNVFLFDSL